MACHHPSRVKVYRRGAAPSYPFLPFGEVCPKCHRHIEPESKVGDSLSSSNGEERT